MLAGKVAQSFGPIQAVITALSCVSFSPYLFLNESHLLSLEICTVPLITFFLHWIALGWMPTDQNVSRTNPNDPLSVEIQ